MNKKSIDIMFLDMFIDIRFSNLGETEVSIQQWFSVIKQARRLSIKIVM